MSKMKRIFSKKLNLTILLILIITAIFFVQLNKKQSVDIVATKEVSLKDASERSQEKSLKYDKAKELVGISGYINTENISVQENIGKNVILIDFWTYSCINCQRTLPYLNSWYQKYKDKGLVIIGVHTPEFEFEKDYSNVKRATQKYKVDYPVVQDNDYQTWRSYKNRYWPRKYLIDIDGFIVYDHIGEGAYDQTEKKIQELLEERNRILALNNQIDKDMSNPDIQQTDFSKIGTPEIYFGYGFQRGQMGSPEGWQPEQVVTYSTPKAISNNKFYLTGDYLNKNDNMELVSEKGTITLKYFAKNVNLVAGTKTKTQISISLDAKPYKTLEVSGFDLYNIVSQNNYGEHILQIDAQEGLMAYTFTFG